MEQECKNQMPLLKKYYEDSIDITSDFDTFKNSLDGFINILTNSNSKNHSLYFDYFVQMQYLKKLMKVLKIRKFSTEYFKQIFHNIEILIKSFKSDLESLELAITLHKEGYITQNYQFTNEQQAQYYILIMKSLVRHMTTQDQRFMSIFVNSVHPHFPIVYNSVKFFNYDDEHVSTASKYIILELSSEKHLTDNFLKRYFINFPFITYYAYMIYYIRDLFTIVVKENKNKEYLISQIEFMEEYVAHKDRQSINMYTNAFFSIFAQNLIKLLRQKSLLINTLIILLQVIKKIKVEKILIGFRKMFSHLIEKDFLALLQKLNIELYSYSFKFKNQFFFDNYIDYIKDHCSRLLSQDYAPTQGSLLKNSIYGLISYVYTTSKWLQDQLVKLSQIFGVKIMLYNQIQHDEINKNCYLGIMQNLNNSMVQNSLYNYLIQQSKNKDKIYYYYLSIVRQLKITKDVIQSKIKQHMSILKNCQSISILFIFYRMIQNIHFEFDEENAKLINKLYDESMSKIINYILQEGWQDFFSHLEEIIENQDEYYSAIFRSISEDIVYLEILRKFLSIKSQGARQGNNSNIYNNNKSNKKKSKINIKMKCWIQEPKDKTDSPLYLKYEGQYFKFYNEEDQLIQIFLIPNYQTFWSMQKKYAKLEFVCEKQPMKSLSVYLQDKNMAEYLESEFKEIKYRIRVYELELQNMNFNIFN